MLKINKGQIIYTSEDFARWGSVGGKKGSKKDKARAGRARWQKRRKKNNHKP